MPIWPDPDPNLQHCCRYLKAGNVFFLKAAVLSSESLAASELSVVAVSGRRAGRPCLHQSNIDYLTFPVFLLLFCLYKQLIKKLMHGPTTMLQSGWVLLDRVQLSLSIWNWNSLQHRNSQRSSGFYLRDCLMICLCQRKCRDEIRAALSFSIFRFLHWKKCFFWLMRTIVGF